MVPKEGAAGRLGGYVLRVAGEIETALNKKRQELCPWNHIGASYEEALAENRVSHRPEPCFGTILLPKQLRHRVHNWHAELFVDVLITGKHL